MIFKFGILKLLNISLLTAFSVMLIACSGDEQSGSSETSELTKEELFAAVMINEFLKEEDDELQEYLQVEIFSLIADAERIYFEKVSTSEYMLTFNDGVSDKKIIINKFFDPVNDQVFFERSEVLVESDDVQD